MLKIEEKNLTQLQNISKIIAVLSFGAFIILIIFGAFQLREIAEANRELDRIKQEIANKQAEIAELDRTLANKDKLLQSKDNQIEAQTNTIKEVFKESDKSTINKVLEKNPVAAGALPRIYLHIGDESERKQAEKIAKTLQSGGFIIPQIENVGQNAARSTELRYCQDKGQPDDLDKIKKLLADINMKVDIRPPLKIPSCSNVSSVRSYELWLESDARNQKKPDKPLIDTRKPLAKEP
jgi:Sec-independent protein translocase protein TatA